jgi:outer membrane protein assembly factor BamD (BamD/ComL family)
MIKYFILVLLLFSHSTYAQNPQPKVKELYEKAEKKIAENKLGEAIKDLLNVVKHFISYSVFQTRANL